MKTSTTKTGVSSKRLRKQKFGQRRVTRQLLNSLQMSRKATKQTDAVNVCTTRTVELASAHGIGEEKHKLLFALALGLIPEHNTKVQHGLSVKLERLDSVVAKAFKTSKAEDPQQDIQQLVSSKQQHAHSPCHDFNPENLVLEPLYLPSDEDSGSIVGFPISNHKSAESELAFSHETVPNTELWEMDNDEDLTDATMYPENSRFCKRESLEVSSVPIISPEPEPFSSQLMESDWEITPCSTNSNLSPNSLRLTLRRLPEQRNDILKTAKNIKLKIAECKLKFTPFKFQ